MKKILVIVNKNWETEPVMNALTHPKLRPASLPFPEVVNTPCDRDNRMEEPRAIITFNKESPYSLQVVIRCIEDLMAAGVNTSNSLEKFKVLPTVIAADAADLIISVSTANHPDEMNSHNGCVIIGGNFFVYDAAPEGMPPAERLIHSDIGNFLASNVNPALFELVNNTFNTKTVFKFIPPVNSPAVCLLCEASEKYSAVSSVNVTDYGAYDKIDEEALQAFEKVTEGNCTANSIETTHGVVKICTVDEPVFFLSPITDRLGHFGEDVTDTQNYIAAFDGGLALGQLLCELAEFVKIGGEFGVR